MNIVRLVENKILSVVEKTLEILDGKNDYLIFEANLKKELDSLGCDLVKAVLGIFEEKIKEDEERKRNWKVIRKNDRKEILTPFGPVEYQRSYYQHKESKEYAYLLDKEIGITPHARVGANLKAELVEASAKMSYEETTSQVSQYNTSLKVSKQTVALSVKEFKTRKAPLPQTKRRVPVLYIEADEDHIKIKDRRGAQARLIYIHEGIEEYPRRHLKNARYFTTVSQKPDQFWMEVLDYIEAHYEFWEIKKIYLSGDGASWIRVGQEYIPGAIFILDKFHVAKYITRATAHAQELKKPIYQGIKSLNKQAVIDILNEALRRAQKEPRQKRIKDTIKYIENNWDGIESAVKNPHVKCSAEGHVSHILSARLSSRPMAWSLQGAENMASIRAIKANGESVAKHYLDQRKSLPMPVNLKEAIQKELKRVKQKRVLGIQNHSNVPLFHSGDSLTRMALRGLNGQMVV